jgi:uncharacterized membrane protein
MRDFLATPKYMKAFVVCSYIAVQVLFIILYYDRLWLAVLPVCIIPVALIVSMILWRVANAMFAEVKRQSVTNSNTRK